MKVAVCIVAVSLMGWCESIGPGCKPLFGSIEDSATGTTSGGESTTVASTSAVPTQGSTASTGASATMTGPGDTTAAVAETTMAGATAVAGTMTTTPGDTTTGTSSTATTGGSESTGEPPQPRVVDIAAGEVHACALLDNGRVRCWWLGEGHFDHGQLGGNDEWVDVEGADEQPLDATEGKVDFAEDVADDEMGNGRMFAGGATTCLTAAGAAASWCWGEGFGKSPVETEYAYSAFAVSDLYDEKLKQWFVCGFVKDGVDYTMRCWGTVVGSEAMFKADAIMQCQAIVTETAAATRDLPLASPVAADAGDKLLCMVAAAPGQIECAGYTSAFTMCKPGDRCTNDGGSCPNPCVTTPCATAAELVGVKDKRVCVASAGMVRCFLPAQDDVFEYLNEEICGTEDAFTATMLAVSDEFMCVVDTTPPDDSKVCCKAFDGPLAGPPLITGPAVKAAAWRDGVIVLDADGKMSQIKMDPLQWKITPIAW